MKRYKSGGYSGGGGVPQGEIDVKMGWIGYGKNPEIPVKMTGNSGGRRKEKYCPVGFVLITIWNCKEMK